MMEENNDHCTKNEVCIKYFFRKYDKIGKRLRIWSHLLKKFLMENFIFCRVEIFLAGGDALVYFAEPMRKKYSTAFVWSHPLST